MGTYRTSFVFLLLSIWSTALGVSACRQTTIIADEIPSPKDTDTVTSDNDTIDSSDSSTETSSDTDTTCEIPSLFSWNSTDLLVGPPNFANSIKDPSAVFDGEQWHVYATAVSNGGYNMTYFNLTNWDQAGEAVQTSAGVNPNLTGYKAAPQLFYFSPEQLWYLIFQTPEPAYSTSSNPSDISSWSPMTQFMAMPSIITNEGDSGIDYWIICDATDCYMFFSGLNGRLYRARTAITAFPDGFEGTTEVVMEDDPFRLYDASNVYKLVGTDSYLLLVSAIGSMGRYFRAWTANRLDGAWTPHAETEENAFASASNVIGAQWARTEISHGEMLRWNPDETMSVDPCNLQYLFSSEVEGEGDTDSTYHGLGLLSPNR